MVELSWRRFLVGLACGVALAALSAGCPVKAGQVDRTGPVLAQVRPAIPAVTAPKITQKQLDKLTRYWQHVLKLDDWEIRARAVSLGELPEGATGASARERRGRYMSIMVLEPADYERAAAVNDTVPKRGKEILRDIEDTIIHELVHLRLYDLVSATDEQETATVEEYTVNRVTSALLAARHGGK